MPSFVFFDAQIMHTIAPLLLAAPPVVDIDGTVLVQLALFLLLLMVLDKTLFKPWLAVRDRRHRAIEGAFEAAEDLRTQAAALDTAYTERLGSAREEALELRSRARRKGEAAGADRVAHARAEAGTSLDVARNELRAAADAARQQLVGRVEDLACQISNKVMGRAA
ncbi:MAG: ATP synthase F0 subunit B [Nannocystaceae bacterium]